MNMKRSQVRMAVWSLLVPGVVACTAAAAVAQTPRLETPSKQKNSKPDAANPAHTGKEAGSTDVAAVSLLAGQTTGKPVPPYKPEGLGKKGRKRIEKVEIKRRGKGSSFGVNIPQEPLMRAGMKPGDFLKVAVRGKTVSLMRM